MYRTDGECLGVCGSVLVSPRWCTSHGRDGLVRHNARSLGVWREAQLMDVTDASWQAEEDSLPTGLLRSARICGGFDDMGMAWL
jgi:hypothetical protein